MREIAGDVFALDARLWRTLAPLFLRPGFLTHEYFAGRRVRYVPPLRLYVFAAIAFFAVMAVTGGGPLRIRVESSPAGTVLRFGAGNGRLDLPAVEPDEAPPGFQGWLVERSARVRERPDDFNTAVFAALSNVHFLLLPLFALLMMPFWRHRFYVEHLVFGMHFQAFLLLLGAAFVGIVTVAGSAAVEAVLRPLFWMVIVAYLFVAVRRIHLDRWWMAAWKVLVFEWLYTVVAVLVVIAVAVVTLALF